MTKTQIFNKAVELRDLMKEVNQLSWNINQFDKRFPLESAVTDDELLELIFNYERLLGITDGIAHLYREATIEDEVVNESKMKFDDNERSNSIS